MSTATLPDLQSFFVTGVDLGPVASYKKGDSVVPGLKIFKTGTFRDSRGDQRTWELEHLKQMIFHYNLLNDRGIFNRVPLRDGHPSIFGGSGRVIGNITNLRDDGEFLYSDLNFTEPDDLAKYQRGTYGPRSLEIGMYTTNNETEYWPVVMGLAFVDIPAVEGLHSNASATPDKVHYFQILTDKEIPIVTPEEQAAADKAAADKAAADKATADHAAAQAAAAAQAQAAAAAQAAADQATADAARRAADHAQGQPVSFRINGQVTSDHTTVQRHIENLETVIRESAETAREEFVKALAGANKILAAQVDDTVTWAKGLTSEQFAAWRKLQEGGQPIGLFNKQANGVTNDGTEGAGGDGAGSTYRSADRSDSGQYASKADEISVLEERIAMHQRSGMTEEQIAKTKTAKRLAALQATA